MIKTPTPKEHPFSSHIPRFAMFPSVRSPDDPETGVRAASQPFLNRLIPNSAPDVTLWSKAIGGPYRHEVLETPVKTRKKAVRWTGDHGFLDQHVKPLKGEKEVFYPTPPKTVLPNPKLRDWDLSLSERTSNMLKNLEKTLWVTTYQIQYTGSGPTNPLQIDDFKEKICNLTGIHAPLRERSYPVFVPSKPKGCRRREGSHVGRSTCSPTAAELPNTSLALNQSSSSATVNQHSLHEITAMHNEAPGPNHMRYSQSDYSTGSTEAHCSEQSQEIFHKQQTQGKSCVCEGRERENHKVQFDESLMRRSMSQSNQEANVAQISNTEQTLDLNNHPHSQGEIEVSSVTELCVPSSKKKYFKVGRNLPQQAVAKDQIFVESPAELLSRAASEQEGLIEGREPLHSISNPCILPRPPVLPVIRPVDRVGALSLLDFQNSFSKSEAHRNFNSLITRAAVNLRDNVISGKKHDFFGINCCYIRG
ncbi:sperm-associated microtubule inner protein 4 [Embiotoca jacksoni]|uniref:sperm-associated microtubule inner protein 4 n=1 Tax=Embiotoca jacksoni TaxID=100190 RepID=UPI0037037ECE